MQFALQLAVAHNLKLASRGGIESGTDGTEAKRKEPRGRRDLCGVKNVRIIILKETNE